MKKMGIREVSASELAEEREPVVLTDNRELVGIFCPVTEDWITHVLTMNESRLQQNLRRGEKELADDLGDQLPSLEQVATASNDEGSSGAWGIVSNVISAVRRTGVALLEKPQHRTIGIAQFNGKTIREAGHSEQILALTNRRQLIGMIIPVGDRFLAHVLEANLSRIHQNIVEGNQELRAGRAVPLEELAEHSQIAGHSS
jgi:hypothetical protein